MSKYEAYNKSESAILPSRGEQAQGFYERSNRTLRDTRNMYFEQHQRVHFCHYGPHPCYVCRVWDIADFANDSLYEIYQLLQKKGLKLVWEKDSPESIGHWQLLTKTGRKATR